MLEKSLKLRDSSDGFDGWARRVVGDGFLRHGRICTGYSQAKIGVN
jgi:hypothetical protein